MLSGKVRRAVDGLGINLDNKVTSMTAVLLLRSGGSSGLLGSLLAFALLGTLLGALLCTSGGLSSRLSSRLSSSLRASSRGSGLSTSGGGSGATFLGDSEASTETSGRSKLDQAGGLVSSTSALDACRHLESDLGDGTGASLGIASRDLGDVRGGEGLARGGSVNLGSAILQGSGTIGSTIEGLADGDELAICAHGDGVLECLGSIAISTTNDGATLSCGSELLVGNDSRMTVHGHRNAEADNGSEKSLGEEHPVFVVWSEGKSERDRTVVGTAKLSEN